ncbi:MAG: hypothetical protein KDK53_24410 [Maritimibacter sp.]|nr:hypothetical protein [Maritimibacter sp.]
MQHSTLYHILRAFILERRAARRAFAARATGRDLPLSDHLRRDIGLERRSAARTR